MKQRNLTGAPTDSDFYLAALAVHIGEASIGNMFSYLQNVTLDPGPSFAFENALYYLRKTNTWAQLLILKQTKRGNGGATVI